ncbi:nitroreductase family deazaflavin-dependent oxidoreductase [Kribbella sp. NPDC050469]|uniref:nitroreductase family deazaflavin-dependent oxidoreductase n=2 Tax=unclassified Kribbella TaxID=2644121 RepID=UPI0037967D7A
MNARTSRKIHAGRDKMMGMDVLVLQTIGRRSGEPREVPLAWFPDGDNAWLVVASGGGSQHPDWHANLMAHPTQATITFAGGTPLPVTPTPPRRPHPHRSLAPHHHSPAPLGQVPSQDPPPIPHHPPSPPLTSPTDHHHQKEPPCAPQATPAHPTAPPTKLPRQLLPTISRTPSPAPPSPQRTPPQPTHYPRPPPPPSTNQATPRDSQLPPPLSTRSPRSRA